MKSGSIAWDDEDDGNRNQEDGVLPDGEFNGNTKIFYCCQVQGQWYNSIELPVDHPFYLLPYSSNNCQRVKWALSTLEYIIYDTEDYRNTDRFSGEHVFTNQVRSLPEIYYCYYEGTYFRLTI